jgi:hypothetical protein
MIKFLMVSPKYRLGINFEAKRSMPYRIVQTLKNASTKP